MAIRTKQQIRTRIQTRVALAWDSNRIDALIQEGYDRLTLIAKLLWIREALADTIHVALYDLPASLQALDRCVWDNRRIPPIPQDDLMWSDAQFATKEGDVFGYMVHGDGTMKLRKLNIPSVSNATKFQIEYFQRDTLASANTPLRIPNRYCAIIEWYVCWRLYEAEGPNQDLDWADHYKSRWEAGLATIDLRKNRFWRLRNRVLAPSTLRGIKPPAPRLPSHYPSGKR